MIGVVSVSSGEQYARVDNDAHNSRADYPPLGAGRPAPGPGTWASGSGQSGKLQAGVRPLDLLVDRAVRLR